MPTVLKLLTRPNVPVRSDGLREGNNSTMSDSNTLDFDSFQDWPDFNYKTLISLWGDDLEKELPNIPDPAYLPMDMDVCDENTVDGLIRRFIVPPVNHALNLTHYKPFLDFGSRVPDTYKPDWSVVSNKYYNDYSYYNCLPGDTKTSKKWSYDMDNHEEWKKPVSQVAFYQTLFRSRYGFILTDNALVAIRLVREKTDNGLAQYRSMRTIHQRQTSNLTVTSDSSDLSSVMSNLGLESSSSFSDNDPVYWTYQNPQAVVIPWSASGKRLTIKLALYSLARLSMSDRTFDYEYPGLDTWRTIEGGYMHNSTTVGKAKLDDEDVIEEPFCNRAMEAPISSNEPEVSGGVPEDVFPIEQEVEVVAEPSTSAAPRRQQPVEDDEETLRSSHRSKGKGKGKKNDTRHHVTIKKDKEGWYFRNRHRERTPTKKKDWTKVEDGWEITRRGGTVYFTAELPKGFH